MRRLLIIGCGDVMRRTLPQLVRRWHVLALVRQRDPQLETLGVTQIEGDLDRPDSLRRLAGIADVVIHSAPPPAQGNGDPRTRNLIAALQRGKSLPRHLVYISTSGVYGDCGGARVSETRSPAAKSARAVRRVDAERRLRRFGRQAGRHCRVSILRAPGIYAEDRLPLERLHKGLPALVDADDVFTNHIHADDLAAACIAALRYGRSNRAYNVVDDSDLKMADYFDRVAAAFKLPFPPRISRAEGEQRLSSMQMSFMRESRRIGNRRLKDELKLRLAFPTVDDGIRAALERKDEC